MNTINTIAPISIENLKKYFADETLQFNIEYKDSTLKGSKLLIYLGNLNIPCDLDSDINDEFFSLLTDYFNSKTLIKLPKLEIAAIEVLLGSRSLLDEQHYGLLNIKQINSFNETNKEILAKWSSILDSLTIFNMKSVNIPEFSEFVDSFPKNDTDDLTGINFVNLLRYEEFYLYYSKIEEKNLTNYTRYFDEYMFKGKNLFYFWATEANPMFLLTASIASGNLKADAYIKAASADVGKI